MTLERHFLIYCFALAVTFFWGGALVAIYSLQEVDRYLSESSFLMLITSLLCVFLSYTITLKIKRKPRTETRPSKRTLTLYRIARTLFLTISVPTIFVAANRFISQSGLDYLEMDSASQQTQAFMYGSLYLYFACLALSNKTHVTKREFFFLAAVAMAPRLMVGSISGRFVAIMPIIALLFIGLSRDYIKIKPRAFIFATVSAAYILFIHPLVRAGEDIEVDSNTVMQILLRSGPVNLMEKVDEVSKEFHEVNFLKTGLFGNIIPSALSPNERVDLWKREGLAVTADRAFAMNEGAGFEEMFGPGSIYVGELYLISNWLGVVLGSLLLGCTIAFTQRLGSLTTIWLVPLLDFAVKVPFVPRSNITYMYERAIPLALLCGAAIILSEVLVRTSDFVETTDRRQPL